MRFWFILVLACCGCGSYFTGMGQNAANGAVNGVTSDDSKKKLSGLVTDATKAARDEALGPTTNADVQKLIQDSGATTNAEVQKILKAAGVTTRAELEGLITKALQNKIQQTVRLSVDEALGPKTQTDVDALRERLIGKPFQDDLNAAIDAAGPHLATVVQTSLGPINAETNALKTTADAEAAKWKPIAIGFGIGGGCLLVCAIFLVIALRSHRKVIESHQKVIESLVKERS